MKSTLIPIFLSGIALSIFAAEPEQDADWKLIKQTGGISIYSRPHPGSKIKEFKAIGEIDASTKSCSQSDRRRCGLSEFHALHEECRVLKEEKDSTITYQRLSPKIVSDRDYTIRIQEKSWPAKMGSRISVAGNQPMTKGRRKRPASSG